MTVIELTINQNYNIANLQNESKIYHQYDMHVCGILRL
jgi:hypothetical protein